MGGLLAIVAALGAGGLTTSRTACAEPLRIDDTAAADKKAYPELDEARQLFAKQDVEGALDAFNAAAKAHADLPNGRILLATIYFTVNRPREGARSSWKRRSLTIPTIPMPT